MAAVEDPSVPAGSRGPIGRDGLKLGAWTLLVAGLVVAATLGLQSGRIYDLGAYLSLAAAIGFGIGLLAGSPHRRRWSLGVSGFAIGSVGTFLGAVVFVLVWLLAFETERVEVIPVLIALFAGLMAIVAGGSCAFGILFGRFLRGRRRARPTVP